MPLRIAHPFPQQYDRPQADPASVAGRGRGPGEEQTAGSGRAQCVARRREKTQTNVDRGARETQSRSVLRRAAATVRRKDRRHRRKTGLEEERGARLVLQSATKAEKDEVRRATLTGC